MLDTTIRNLGLGKIPSCIHSQQEGLGCRLRYTTDEDRVIVDDNLASVCESIKRDGTVPAFERAGPRNPLFFDPQTSHAAIVTCGGLCPGLNDVIRGLVMELYYRYGVKKIYGVKYGYEGFIARYQHEIVQLYPHSVSGIQTMGGSILGSSRGEQDSCEIVDCLQQMEINMLFVIGGDGSLRGAYAIGEEIARRGLQIAVVGVPKTIDNDIMYIDKSFGFETAFDESVKAIDCAHTEALGARNGIGLVRLMGRHSGFIACYAALANNDVNYVMIPEVPFKMDGPRGFLASLKTRLEQRRHAVVLVAEGAGQELIGPTTGTDASGNARMGDIGDYLKKRIEDYFRELRMEHTVKYIDPSYIIRSVPANAQDSVFCSRLAQNAVHAAMAGKTQMVVGRWHGHFVHLPIPITTSGRRRVDPEGDLWLSVLESTGQPMRFE